MGSGTTELAYEYDVNAHDPDQDILTYTLIEAPESMVINPTTGLVSLDFAEGGGIIPSPYRYLMVAVAQQSNRTPCS